MPLLLSDEEIQALNGLPHLHFILYVKGIRQYMDYKTGIVGIKRGISYQSLSEEVFISGMQGIRKTKFSHQQIKRALGQLEKIGLIERRSVITKDEKRLVLACIFAQTDKSVKNKADLTPTRPPDWERDSIADTKSTINIDTNGEIKNKGDFDISPQTCEKADPPPVSGKDIKLYNSGDDEIFAEIGDYKQILIECGYGLSQIQNYKTITMLQAFKREGVLLADVKLIIEAHKANLGALAAHPTYYAAQIMKAKNEKATILQKLEDGKNEPNTARRQHQTYPRYETVMERAQRLLNESKGGRKLTELTEENDPYLK
jgi:hypothetical protein